MRALSNAGILKHIFTYVPGHYIFVGAVCREWKAAYVGIPDQKVRCYRAFGGGCDIIHWLVYSSKTTVLSATVASPATVRLAFDCGLQVSSGLQVIAGLHADVKVLTLLLELGLPLSAKLVQAAALSGHLDSLQHLLCHQQCPTPLGPLKLSHFAARSGNISMLNWLKAQKWFLFHCDAACIGAAKGGQLLALQHLRSEGGRWHNRQIATDAASSGSIETVEWLRQQQGVVINEDTLSEAIIAGHIEMCQHLVSCGCAYSAEACNDAAVYGYIDILRWLRAVGCPWDVHEVCMQAMRSSNFDILEFVIEQGEVLSAELLTAALNHAAIYGELQAAQRLRQLGAQWPAVLSYNYRHPGETNSESTEWDDDVVAWARTQGCDSPLLP
jgi:hypothetical protein